MVSLIVAEKPSVARDLAKVLKVKSKVDSSHYKGNRVWITWCLGHMAELCEPAHYDPAWKAWRSQTLPMLPEDFQVRPIKRSADHWRKLAKLFTNKNIDTVINACDAGREGELIFRYAYELAGCNKPVRRLWLSSLTDKAIQDGLRNMRPGSDFDALGDAARSRSEADWLIGLNATRALTILSRRHGGGQLFSVGRVQTPTLAIIVERELEIESFVPEPFWQLYGHFKTEGGQYQGLWHTPDGKTNRLDKEPDAKAIVAAVTGKTGAITKVEQKKVRERPPLLFDLTQLQRAANRRYGYSAAATLAAAQTLYEKYKILTYPRTDSNHLTTDMVASLPGRLRGVNIGPYAPFCQHLLGNLPLPTSKRIVNNKEVGDHHAIIPTGRKPNIESLPEIERRVFALVVRRFIAVFYPPAIFATTRIETTVEKHLFVTRGRVCLDPGWHAVEPQPKTKKPSGNARAKKGAAADSGKGKEPEQELPIVKKGQPAIAERVRLHKGMTQPPKRYNEASLLGAMERAGSKLDDAELRRAMKESGLGTPATRANIIETLLRRDFIQRKGKNLVPTDQGRTLIQTIPVDDLKSARLTGSWEARLSQIADGRISRQDFMAEVRKLTATIIPNILSATDNPHLAAAAAAADNGGNALGKCPVCNTPVTEGFKAYSCRTGRDCTFVIFKTVAKRKISPKLVQVLLAKRRTKVLKGFRSKAGKTFETALILTNEGKIAFDFGGNAGGGGGSLRSSPNNNGGSGNQNGGNQGDDPFGPMSHVPHPASYNQDENPFAPSSNGPPAARPPQRNAPPAPAPPAPAAAASATQPPPTQTKPPQTDTQAPPCPCCKEGHMIKGRKGWGCSRWRQGCRFVVWFEQHGHTIPDDEADRLLRKGRTRMMNGFTDPQSGQTIRARLALDLGADNNVVLEPSKAKPRKSAAKKTAQPPAANP